MIDSPRDDAVKGPTMKTNAPNVREMSEAHCHRKTLGQGYQDGFEAGVLAERERVAAMPPTDAAALVTEAELDEVERLDREATPGPWLHNDYYETVQTHSERTPLAAVCRYGNTAATSADHDLIARARALLPRLAAEVRRLTAEVTERDARIARLAVESAAVEAKLTIEAMTANQRAADRADALASAEERLNTIGDVARDILLAAEDSAVPEHSDVPTRLIDALRKAVAR